MTASADTQALQPRDVLGAEGRIIEFVRLLRHNGFCVGQAEVRDAVRYLSTNGLPTERQLRSALRALFCTRRAEIERFGQIFDAYWRSRLGRSRTTVRQALGGQRTSVGDRDGHELTGAGGLARYFDWADEDNETDALDQDAADPGQDTGRLGGASRHAATSSTDFGEVTDPDQFEQIMALADRLGARLRYRISRRFKASGKRQKLNLRRTFRGSTETGGLPLRLFRKTRKEPPISLVLFVDVSGSMDAYSLFFMRFIHAMTGRFAKSEAFIFHTKLVHVSKALSEANPIKMMKKMSLISQGWSGGTRIGEALATFNANYAREFTNSRTVSIIMSDGYDTGPADVLDAEMRKLKSRCHKIIWLNPMLGRQSYEPVTQGMMAAKKHVDLFAAAHNLESLSSLEDALVRA